MAINTLFDRIFGRSEKPSREVAKERLVFALQADRVTINPAKMDQVRQELFAVLSRHFEIDSTGLDFSVERDGTATALVASIPIRRVKAE
jgi:cell division topological specificity factor MinE